MQKELRGCPFNPEAKWPECRTIREQKAVASSSLRPKTCLGVLRVKLAESIERPGYTSAKGMGRMRELLLVGVGGFIGATLRYKIGGLVLHHTVNWKFPAATFLVNICGCLVAGILMALAIKQDLFSPSTRLLLFTGILGGFTTFSAFSLETVYLLQRQEILWAGLYVVLTVCVGIAALWLGMFTVR